MTITFLDNKKRDIVFEDPRTREKFFQTLSQIKHIHRSETDVSQLSVSYTLIIEISLFETVDE